MTIEILVAEFLRIMSVLVLGPGAYFGLMWMCWWLLEPRSRHHRRRVKRKVRQFKKWWADREAWAQVGEPPVDYGSLPGRERNRVRR